MQIINKKKFNINLLSELNDICDKAEKIANENKLNLLHFKGLRIVDDYILSENSDANLNNMELLLPKNKTEKHIVNKEYNLLKSTIYHELCHVDLHNRYPQLHFLFNKYLEEENYIKGYTIMITIEYIAQLMTREYENYDLKHNYLISFYERKWNFMDEGNKIMFIKAIPYTLSRDYDGKYMKIIQNDDLCNRILELKNEFNKLIEKLEDNYNCLVNLERVVQRYIYN